jgi:ERCC4-type nuclease
MKRAGTQHSSRGLGLEGKLGRARFGQVFSWFVFGQVVGEEKSFDLKHSFKNQMNFIFKHLSKEKTHHIITYTSNMNSTSITDYILKLEKENADSRTKIEGLKKLYMKSEEERVAALKKLNSKLLESSLYETTARTKTFQVNKDIAEHLRELGDMTSDFYKDAAYRRAADIIDTLNHEVKNGQSLLNINGIGTSIANRIDAFLNEYYDDQESVASNEGQILGESDTDDDFYVSYNSALADILDSLSYYEKNEHKSDAYDNAAYIIDQLPFKVTCGEEISEGPNKVKGIGKSIAKIIDEFLKTGKVEKLENLKKGTSTNEEVAIALETLASETDDAFKARAFENAAKNIRKLTFEVTNGTELAEGPNKVKGIGKSIARKIDTFLQTGEM